MAREHKNRPLMRERFGKADATKIGDVIGVVTQVIPDGGGSAVCDPEANLYVSEESTNAPTFSGLDLDDESVMLIPRTFKRIGSEVVTVTLAQAIDANTSYTLDDAGASITVVPTETASGALAWALIAAVGTVSAVP